LDIFYFAMRKNYGIILSVLIIITSYYFIVYKIVNFENLQDFSFSLTDLSIKSLSSIIIVFLMMFLNWSIEAFKWKLLIENVQPLPFIGAIKAVFAGITVGIFTPNRIGDIGGRVSFLPKGKRTFGVLVTGIGSFAQLITTLSAGIIGLAVFIYLLPETKQHNNLFNVFTVALLITLFLILLWSYFNFSKIKSILLKIPFFKKRHEQLDYFSNTPKQKLFKVFLLSLLRYCVFSSQFYLLLILFNIPLTPVIAYTCISLIYLFTSIIPKTTLAELGIRGSLSIFFIGMFAENVLGIVVASISLWIINLAVPAIFGSYFLFRNTFWNK